MLNEQTIKDNKETVLEGIAFELIAISYEIRALQYLLKKIEIPHDDVTFSIENRLIHLSDMLRQVAHPEVQNDERNAADE